MPLLNLAPRTFDSARLKAARNQSDAPHPAAVCSRERKPSLVKRKILARACAPQRQVTGITRDNIRKPHHDFLTLISSSFALGARASQSHPINLTSRWFSFFRREDREAGDQRRESVLRGDGGISFRLRLCGEVAQETPKRTREAHMLAVLQELRARLAPEQAHQVRVRPGAEGPVSLLLRQDEATRSRLQAHSTVSPRQERLRDRSQLRTKKCSADCSRFLVTIVVHLFLAPPVKILSILCQHL